MGSSGHQQPISRDFISTSSDVDEARILSSIVSSLQRLAYGTIHNVDRIEAHRRNDTVCRRLQIETPKCEPHTCPCGKEVDARGLNGLSCRRSSARQQRHAELNDIIRRSIKRAQIPVSKEPAGLSRTDEKRPDEVTLIPWSRGKPLAWDVTVPDTFIDSHLKDTCYRCAAANRAAELKCTKYADITSIHVIAPIAIETSRSWNEIAIETIQKIGRRMTKATNDPNETIFIPKFVSCHTTG